MCALCCAQAKASESAVAQANAAVEGGHKAAVFCLDVGLDAKAMTKAWAACQKAHPQLPVMFISSDAGAPSLGTPCNRHYIQSYNRQVRRETPITF